MGASHHWGAPMVCAKAPKPTIKKWVAMFDNLSNMAGEVEAGALNTKEELVVEANCFASPVFPKHGTLTLGNNGMEFLADSGYGYIQIPWQNIDEVVCDILGSYVRAIDVATDEAAPINFVITNGAAVLRCINEHIGRDKLRPSKQNLKHLGTRVKDKVKSVMHRSNGPAT